MDEQLEFKDISPTILADVLPVGQVISACIRPLWLGMPRCAGPAYTVRCGPGDNLMLHAAVYRAPPGSIVVVEGGDTIFALAGGQCLRGGAEARNYRVYPRRRDPRYC